MRKFISIILVLTVTSCLWYIYFKHSNRITENNIQYKNFDLNIGIMRDEDTVIVSGNNLKININGKTLKSDVFIFNIKESSPAIFKYHLIKETMSGKERPPFIQIFKKWIPVGEKNNLFDNTEYFVSTDRLKTETDAVKLQDKLYKKDEKRWILKEKINKESGIISINNIYEKKLGESDKPLLIQGDKLTVHKVLYGKGYSFEGREDRVYPGNIMVRISNSGKLLVINKVHIEEYLKGVLPSEIYPDSPFEALKTQAIAARSEILSKWKKRHLSDNYDFCDDQHCQVYAGYKRRNERTNRAVDETRGMVLIKNNNTILDAVYHSNCGGITANNEDIWISKKDNSLRSIQDTDERIIIDWNNKKSIEKFLKNKYFFCATERAVRKNHFRWEKNITLDDINKNLQEKYPEVTSVLKIKKIIRGKSGRISDMCLITDKGDRWLRREYAIRRVLGNLRSALFIIDEIKSDTGQIKGYSIKGAGWGHGVGMCQDGAIGMAARGFKYENIIDHYYKNIAIKNLAQ